MAIVSVRIPQMGEGLQEARLVEFLKRPGDRVRRDEPIYVMETDKAVTEVESPMSGKLVEWLVEPDNVLPIGTEIARLEVESQVADESPASSAHQPSSSFAHATKPTESIISETGTDPVAAMRSNGGAGRIGHLGVPIPPRTRKYLREKGLLAQAALIPAAGKKLLPVDIDRYLSSAPVAEPRSLLASQPTAADDYIEAPIPKVQQTLNYRMQRGAEACIPAVLELDIEWTALNDAREKLRASTGESAFSLLIWCIVQAMREHPLLRSTISADGKTLRTYRHINIGVAVAVEKGLLRTAVVRGADRLNRESFSASLKAQIETVRAGADQIDATTTATVSNIGATGVRMGIPVVVTPAVATLALGQVRPHPFPMEGHGFHFRPVATLTMTFDHRILNGVAAAEFLADVRRRAESFAH